MADNKMSQVVVKQDVMSTYLKDPGTEDCCERNMAHSAGVQILAKNLSEAQRLSRKRIAQHDRLK
ncbi:MAG: hypothetical protein HY711_07985 [Candidatus Melainabacteria bacterium]|nr:hypothetical protein [Candidatus Melainabacteria bacterium]